MKTEDFIFINLNQNISRARKAAQKDERDKWIVFGLVCFIFLGMTGWFFHINYKFDELIRARENTIEEIKDKTASLRKDAKINLSKGDILSSYDLGKSHIPWSKKLMQLSEMTPNSMCITKLIYDTKSLTISAISKIEDESVKEQQILNDFMKSIKSNDDFYKEFDEIKIKKTKKNQSQGSIYLAFEISAKIKKKLKNRIDDIDLSQVVSDAVENDDNNDESISEIEPDSVKEIDSTSITEETIVDIVDNVDKTKSKIKLDSLKEDIFDPTSQASNKNQTLGKKQVHIKKEYSEDLIRIARSIDIKKPNGTEELKRFQDELDLYKTSDPMYGIFDLKTEMIYIDILDIEPKNSWEREKRKIDQKILSDLNNNQNEIQPEEKITKKSNLLFDKITMDVASKIAIQVGAGAIKPDIDLIKQFQELTGIANENDSWYGDFNSDTIEMLGKVMEAQE